jgi:hypothetical protein
MNVTDQEKQIETFLWAQEELGEAAFGDKRLTDRFIQIVRDISSKPETSIPQACADWAATKATYRFLDNDRIKPEAMRAAHINKTVERTQKHKTVLAIQDTTSLNYARHPGTTGLGPIDAHGTRGIHVHSVLAVSSDGIPLGLLHQQNWVRDPDEKRGEEDLKKLPIEEKESYRWLQSQMAVEQATSADTHIIMVADREADIFELFALPRPENMDFLIRAAQDRCVQLESDELGKLRESVEAVPPANQTMTLEIEHQPGKPSRQVTLALRWITVSILPPAYLGKKHIAVTVTAILVTEVDPPPGEKALEWLLLTTLEISDFCTAAQCVLWYRLRWLIERYHFVLKSGCHLEKLQLNTALRLERALAVYCIVAWRLLYLTYLSRKTPSESCEVFFQPYEWQALYAFTYQMNSFPEIPPSLCEATRIPRQIRGIPRSYR